MQQMTPEHLEKMLRTAFHTVDALANATGTGDYATRMRRVDGCPSGVCGYEKPIRVDALDGDDDGFLAWYACSICSQTWVTAWSDL